MCDTREGVLFNLSLVSYSVYSGEVEAKMWKIRGIVTFYGSL